MKLETSIPMRTDGTVRVAGLDGKAYVFKMDAESGMVSCDVSHDETLAHLLRIGTFFPIDMADYDKAESMLDMSKAPDTDGDDGQDDGDDDEDEEVDPNALPVEAGTPPAPRKKKAKAE
jgi:hypothetical protein